MTTVRRFLMVYGAGARIIQSGRTIPPQKLSDQQKMSGGRPAYKVIYFCLWQKFSVYDICILCEFVFRNENIICINDVVFEWIEINCLIDERIGLVKTFGRKRLSIQIFEAKILHD